MEHSSQKKSLTITAIIVALGIVVGSTAVNAFLMMTTTTPAYAAPSKDEDIRAFADWDVNNLEVPGLGTLISADLGVHRDEDEDTRLNLGLKIDIDNVRHCAQGFTTIDPNLFDADKKLTSATLSPVTMEVVILDEVCEDVIGTAEITIQATWEGIGEVFTSSSRSQEKSDEGSIKIKNTIHSREAIAEGSINGADLGTTSQFTELEASKASSVES